MRPRQVLSPEGHFPSVVQCSGGGGGRGCSERKGSCFQMWMARLRIVLSVWWVGLMAVSRAGAGASSSVLGPAPLLSS